MIKADPGRVAYYRKSDESHRPHAKAIEAWDDDGHPMVVESKGLVRAESIPGYDHIDLEGDPLPFAFIPGNGWVVEREDGEREPLVAWAMCSYGQSGTFALPVFAEDVESYRGGTWTTASLGGDPRPVRVFPEKRTDSD
ncbi:hypothetical protein [Nocardiopsis kunsanensis]|uniref:Uncharacterized protein n=1 Tax=Nocardiopsis kunsanensis TaxID=141693 RepID=A0A919CM10_9ACTN|nr:hypothetical protein [Nocardiopsis kunsanensis]GHD37424.1 hypothetical protein GCM10007147_45450 [Nocardiopsis kunsanensis]